MKDNKEKRWEDSFEEGTLADLCYRYRAEKGAGERILYPDVTVRYVKKEGRFGYARFGDFFFFEGCLYVFDTDERWKTVHEQDAVSRLFGEEYRRNAYARKVIYAGMRTSFCDNKGERIYTGDLVRWGGSYFGVALTRYGHFDIVGDNCSLSITEENCQQICRVGTLFYRLREEDCNCPKLIWSRCLGFVPFGPRLGGDTTEELVQLAKSTPCFDGYASKYRIY